MRMPARSPVCSMYGSAALASSAKSEGAYKLNAQNAVLGVEGVLEHVLLLPMGAAWRPRALSLTQPSRQAASG